MSKIASTAQTLVAFALTAAASAGPLPGFNLAAQTPHFAFYSRGAKVDADKSERYLAEVEKMLGNKLEGQAVYYRHERPEDIAVVTGSYAAGVTFAGRREIHSTEDFHAHEIVHLVSGQMGNPGPLFHEGLAVALGNEGRWRGSDVDKLARKALEHITAHQLLSGFEHVPLETAYAAAGSFVRSLIRTHGLDKVAGFFRACPSPHARNAAFQKTFGLPLEQAAQEWAQAL